METFILGEGGGRTEEEFTEKLTNARALINYLEEKGINARRSRIGRYTEFYDRYLSQKCSEQEVRDHLLFVMREMDEWSWIYRGLTIKEPDGFLELLKIAIGGPEYAKEETENTRPRNIQLELRVASYFLQAGYEVSFAGVEDLLVKIGRYRVFIECKRIGSAKQIRKRAKEAVRQLKRRYAGARGQSYGLAVLDVSRVIHPLQGIAMGVNETVARDGLRAQLVKLDRDYDTSDIFSKDRRLIAVWHQAIAPTIHEAENDIATRFSSLYSIYGREGQKKWDLFQQMKMAFEVV
ncbi:hypothetical protein LCGC14_0751080 [marine sediment metagenome]|uniref:Uncharacterized protein n=1 Tax=marine sediment metagenome TaxID=412755 RepID=A0A0F9TAX3_9ZZZZ|nr:hypothetical protein [Methylophaga sp.]